MVRMEDLKDVDYEFEKRRKLSDIEYKGLERYLEELIITYEKENLGVMEGEEYRVSEQTLWRNGIVDLIDGYEVTGEGFVIHSAYLTKNGIMILYCEELDVDLRRTERYVYKEVR